MEGGPSTLHTSTEKSPKSKSTNRRERLQKGQSGGQRGEKLAVLQK